MSATKNKILNTTKFLNDNIEDPEERQAKRKRLRNTMKAAEETEIDDVEKQHPQLTLKIRSSDRTKQYLVSIGYNKDGIQYQCNCGDQFGLKDKRNSCRHIATAVLQMNKAFLNNHLIGEKPQAVDTGTLSEIVALLEKFKI